MANKYLKYIILPVILHLDLFHVPWYYLQNNDSVFKTRCSLNENYRKKITQTSNFEACKYIIVWGRHAFITVFFPSFCPA